MSKTRLPVCLMALLICGLMAICSSAQELSAPVVQGRWIQPSDAFPAQPVWGHADGIRIGLWPMPGPRGLLRVYAPYLGHDDDRMINYIAVEPTLEGQRWRSFSELEKSLFDGVSGLRFWSADSPEDEMPRDPRNPSQGIISRDGEVETLCIYVFVEPYENGASVVLRIQFRSDRPYEVGIATFTQPESKPLETCIITATMGNFARLRELHLADGMRSSHELWPTFSGSGFAEHACFSLSNLVRTPSEDALFIATPDEENPSQAEYERGTFIGWTYYGDVAQQYWRDETPTYELRGCVNARSTYWASESHIPGGSSFENFELIERFREGNELWFGVMPGKYSQPQQLTGAPAN